MRRTKTRDELLPGKPRPIVQSLRKTRSSAEAGGKKGHSCKPLPIRFRLQGFDYRQIAREGDVAIYEQTWAWTSSRAVCYEVIRIRRRDGFMIHGRYVEPADVYPQLGGVGH